MKKKRILFFFPKIKKLNFLVEPSRPCIRSFSPSLSKMNSPKYTSFTRWQETAVTARRRGAQALSSYLPLMRSACFLDWIVLYTFHPSLCKDLTLKLNLPEAYGSPADICGALFSPRSSHYEYSCSSTWASSYICLHHYASKLFKSRTPPAPRTSSIKFQQSYKLENKCRQSPYTTFYRNSLQVVQGIKISWGFCLNAGL